MYVCVVVPMYNMQVEVRGQLQMLVSHFDREFLIGLELFFIL